MKVYQSMYGKAVHLACGVALAAAAIAGNGAARAEDVYWSVGLSQPGISLGFSNAPQVAYPQVVYSQPQVVYAQPRRVYLPPQPVYVQPRAVYQEPWPVIVQREPVYFERRHEHRHAPVFVNQGPPVPAWFGWRQAHQDRRADWHDGRRDTRPEYWRDGRGGVVQPRHVDPRAHMDRRAMERDESDRRY